MRIQLLAGLALAVSLAGCTELQTQWDPYAGQGAPKPLRQSDVDTLKPGITTREDAITLFGEPQSIQVWEVDGTETLIWRQSICSGLYSCFSAHGKTERKELLLNFDRSGTLIEVGRAVNLD